MKGALRAALKRGDLMEAEQVRKVMTENFDVTGLEDDSASDPETAADDCDSTTSSTVRSNTGTGETTTAPTTMSATSAVSTSQSVEDEPTLTQVDDLGDSQATLVGDDTEIVDTSSPLVSRTVDGAGVVIAFNSNRSDEDGEEVRKDHNHADPLV